MSTLANSITPPDHQQPPLPDVSSAPFATALADDPGTLAEIYRKDTHITIWRRSLATDLQRCASALVDAKPSFALSVSLDVNEAQDALPELLGEPDQTALSQDIANLVEMFCVLFDLKRAGVRLNVINKAMCPKFHVDRIPCRLVSTYHGDATEWLPDHAVDRRFLGYGSGGKSDSESGLITNPAALQQLRLGDVALLKGELWDGNEGKGLVHRSPDLDHTLSRLLLTLDFA